MKTAERVYLKLKYPVEYTDLYSPGHNDSLDYAGELGEVAFVGSTSRGVSIVVAGETCFSAPNGTRFKNRTAESEGYGKNEVAWDMNNWFELVPVIDGKRIDRETDVEYDLNRAIQRAMEMLEDSSLLES